VLHGSITSPQLNAINARRLEIAVLLAALSAEDDALLLQQGRLEAEANQIIGEPYLVGTKWLIAKLNTSPSAFNRLVRNKAKGFPAPKYAVSSDPQWVWHEVKAYIDRCAGI
jgi:hypothetical protein